MSARRERLRRKQHARGGPARTLLLATAIAVTVVTIGALSAVGYVVGIAASAPDLSALKPIDPGQSSVIYAADGSKLGVIESDVLRDPIRSWYMPQTIKDATVAIEDRRFYEHEGVDLEGIVRAAFKNVRSGETVQGGSTLTMQLVRTLYISNERTFERKIREAKLAEELENLHTGRRGKNWVLTKYLNNVPYGTVKGRTAVGIQAAARVFFNKSASSLELHEAALLAGLPQAPTSYNPFLNPERALARRNDVLDAMAGQGKIDRATAEEAKQRELGVESNGFYTKREEAYFFDYVRKELIDRYGVEKVRRGGLRVTTTIDLDLQKKARKAIRSKLNGDDAPSSAIVSIDSDNGAIRAMASSATYGKRKFNLAAQGKRQPGSTFKVMALMNALERGVPLSTSYVSKPLKFGPDSGFGTFEVKNYGNSYRGSIDLTRAVVGSDNAYFIQLALDLGPEKIAQTAREMGIDSKLNGYPGETLGGLERGVSPLEMANAYATIAAEGWRHKEKAITKVEFPDGEVDDLSKPRRHKAFDDAVTYEATKLLVKNMQGGTGTKAQIGCPAGGKTGTTDKNTDAWFVGFTPKLATAVWVGYPDSNKRQMQTQYYGGPVDGGTFPAEIWGAYNKLAGDKACAGDFPKPDSAYQTQPFFGKNQASGSGRESFGDSPPPVSYDTPGGAAPAPTPSSPPSSGGGGGSNSESTGGFDPDLYESPPQGTPAPAASPGASGGASPASD